MSFASKLNFEGYTSVLGHAGRRLFVRWAVFVGGSLGLSGLAAIFGGLNYGIGALIVLGMFAPFVPPLRRRLRPLSALGPAMQAFAHQNAMRYIEIAKPNYDKYFLPALAKIGLFERKEQIVGGTYAGYPFETYVDTFRHPFDNQLSRVATRVYRIQLPRELPHIFMRNRQSGKGFFDSVMRHFDDDQRVRLEGNFEDMYTTYTHRRTITETLSLLAPNFMETLIHSNKKFDVEFVGNNLYLYTSDYYTTSDELEAAFETIDRLLKHINHRLKSWQLTIPNDARYPYLVSRPGFGTVALGHTYFNRSFLFIGGYTVISLVKIWAIPQWRLAKLALVAASDVVMAVVLLYFRRRYQLSRRSRRTAATARKHARS